MSDTTTRQNDADERVLVTSSLTAALFQEISRQYRENWELAVFALQVQVYPGGVDPVLRVLGGWPPGEARRDLEGLRLYASVFGLSTPAPKYPGNEPYRESDGRAWESWVCYGEIAGSAVEMWAAVGVTECGACGGAGNVDCGDACLCTFECAGCEGRRYRPVELAGAQAVAE